MRLVPLNQHEADVYFKSDWYLAICRARRAKMIRLGTIEWPEPHRFNPPPVRPGVH